MAKSSKKKLDSAMACEVGKTLSPFTLTLKHVRCLNQTGQRFLFAYTHQGSIYYDTVDVMKRVMGVRRKPEKFLLPELVRERLINKVYTRWYFEDDDYLYPLQSCKVQVLLDGFHWITDEHVGYRTHVVAEPDTMFLRKKPLVRVRPSTVTWEDVTPIPPTPKSTVQLPLQEMKLELA